MIEIRNATEADLPQLLDIYNDIIINTTAVYDYEPHTLAMRKQWFDIKQQQGFPIFVAIDNGEITGFSSFGTFRPWAGFRFSVENSIYVSKNHRGKGVAKLLLPPLIEAAKALGLHTIIAGIDATNEASIKLHEHFGFVETAHMKEVGFKFDKWLDLKFLQLIIK